MTGLWPQGSIAFVGNGGVLCLFLIGSPSFFVSVFFSLITVAGSVVVFLRSCFYFFLT